MQFAIFLFTCLRDLMLTSTKVLSFWGINFQDPVPGLHLWTPLGTSFPIPLDLCRIVGSRFAHASILVTPTPQVIIVTFL